MESASIPTKQTKSGAELLDDLARDIDAAVAGQTSASTDKGETETVDNAAPAPSWAARLAPQHAKLITDSEISPEVAEARGYFTATKKAELKRLGFKDYQQLTPALVVPIYGVTGDIVNYQIRPDHPRIQKSKDGKSAKPLKYETVAGSRMALDVPPPARKWLGYPKRPLFITEGVRKADAAVSRGLCCVALLGVWNWRGTNDEGGLTALADWEHVALKGRKVYITFDSDVVEKEAVQYALARLKAFLGSRGADLKIIYLPSGDGGVKVGLDDYFADGHTVDELFALATDKLRVTIDTSERDKPIDKVISKMLADGRVLEQIAGGQFAVYDPKTGKIEYGRKVETDDAIYRPLDDDFVLKGGLFLPDRLVDYGDDVTLDAEIETCINRYSDVPERERRLSARYARLSYLTDKLSEVAYLHAIGPRGSGKSRYICTTGMLCMRSVLVTSPSAASLYRMMDAYHPTLIIDECNLATNNEDTQALIQILNSGFQRLTSISRCEKGADGQQTVRMFSPFGPKLIGGLKLSDSEAFESRCVQMRLEKTARKDIPFRMTDRMLADFAELRAKLYMWRLKNLRRDWEKAFDDSERQLKSYQIEPRFVQIAIPIYGMIADKGLKEDFAAMMEVRTIDAANEKKESFDGQIVALVHSQLFDVMDGEENGKNVTKAIWKNGAPPTLEDGEPCEALAIPRLAELLNATLPDKRKVDNRWLGKECRNLGFLTREITKQSPYRKKSAVVFDRTSLEKVFASFSLPIPANSDPAHPACEPKPANANNLRMPDQKKSEPSGESSSGIRKLNKTDNLTDHAGCAGSEFPEYSPEESAWSPSGQDAPPPTRDGYHVPQEIWPADWKAPWDNDRILDAIAE